MFSVFLHPLRNPCQCKNKPFTGLQLVVIWFIPLVSGNDYSYMWFLWSGADYDNCDGADVCTAIKSLEMKLEAQLENLYSLVENISMSLQLPPGELRVTDLIGSSVFRFFVLVFFFLSFFCNECFI